MKPSPDSPIRLTVCDTADAARRLVSELQQAGFTAEEISVVCSQESCEREFAEFIHEHPAGSEADHALNVAGAGALGLGAAAVAAGVLTTAGTAIMIIGAMSGLAIAGTLAALMVTRGAEKALADYYDQAVSHGKILVAVETDDTLRQRQADRILGHEGEEQTAIPKEALD